MNPVVDIIFNGANSAVDNWFTKDRVLQVIKGPNVRMNFNFNFWNLRGDFVHGRHFFLSKQYGGCPGDVGMIVVNDK